MSKKYWNPKDMDWDLISKKEKILFKFIEEYKHIPLTTEVIINYHNGIKELKDLAVDAEVTHMLEDNLMHLFIEHLSEGVYNKITATKLAKEINLLNKTIDDIGRWYA